MLLLHLRTLLSFAFYHQLSFVKKRLMVIFGIYLFLLSLLIAYFAGTAYINKNLPLLLKAFPEVTFEKGILTSPDGPVSVSLPDSPVQLIFDASKDAVPPPVSATAPLIWVHNNQILISANGRTQTQFLPEDLSFVTSQENLSKYQSILLSSARLAFLFFSAFFILFMLFFSFCLAFAAGLAFRLIRQISVPYPILARWAFFLLGPLSILWYIELWVKIPLFSFAQLIVCVIYMQQIFNLLPEVPPHEN